MKKSSASKIMPTPPPKKSLLAAGLLLVVVVVATYLALRPAPAAKPARAAARPRQAASTLAERSSDPAPADSPALPPVPVSAFQADAKLAREALALVGTSPEADQYWIASINDLSLSNKERRELIEDLTDTGLPPNPTVENLPLIVTRIQLIDQLAPAAIDQINANAFAEARKDLVNFVTHLAQPAAQP
ncbi:MAG: hypothetical protein WCL04_03460 [Verrucomicrobiota bacterium]